MTVPVSEQIFSYLDNLPVNLRYNQTIDTIIGVAQFASVKRNTVSKNLSRWLKKHPNPSQSSGPAQGTPPATVTPKFADITEDNYKLYLVKCMNELDVDIRICTEIRNYLDKKKAIAQNQPQEVDPDFGAANGSITSN